jgi:hypothetical protein
MGNSKRVKKVRCVEKCKALFRQGAIIIMRNGMRKLAD